LLDRLRDGYGPGRELVLERTGEEAERTAAGDVRAREDDPVDLAVAVEIGGVRGGDPGLAGARGPENDDLGRFAKGVEIVSLRGIERFYRRQRAFGFEFGVLELYDFSGSQQALVTASLLREVLTQGSDPSGGLKDKCIRQRTARGRGYCSRLRCEESGRLSRATCLRGVANSPGCLSIRKLRTAMPRKLSDSGDGFLKIIALHPGIVGNGPKSLSRKWSSLPPRPL